MRAREVPATALVYEPVFSNQEAAWGGGGVGLMSEGGFPEENSSFFLHSPCLRSCPGAHNFPSILLTHDSNNDCGHLLGPCHVPSTALHTPFFHPHGNPDHPILYRQNQSGRITCPGVTQPIWCIAGVCTQASVVPTHVILCLALSCLPRGFVEVLFY